jgi:hypothetical protein
MPDVQIFLITLAEVLVVLIFGYWFFQRLSPSFVEEL